MEGKEKSCTFFIILFLIFSSFDLSLFVNGQTLPIVEEKGVETYIVHVQRPKGKELLGDEDREAWHRSFLPNKTLDSGRPRLVYSYRDVIGGFAARLTKEEVKAMESMEGFMHAEPDEVLSATTTYTPKFLGLSQTEGLWVNSFMGQGVIIGVIDNGITPGHSSFKDSSVDSPMPPPPLKWKGRCLLHNMANCNNKLIGAISFLRGRTGPLTEIENSGHGTHCAGIAGGSIVPDVEVDGLAEGTASGIAPRAHLAIYQVCTSKGCIRSDVIKGIDQAIADGVDVLSISQVPPVSEPFYSDSAAIGALSAVRKGIAVCMAGGNGGPFGSSIVNDSPWAMTVGASSHDRRAKAVVKLGDGTEIEGETGYQSSNFSSTLPLVFPGARGQNGTEGCKEGSFTNVDVKGKMVICNMEEGFFKTMGVNVKKAGGEAMIIGNTNWEGSTTCSDVHVLPTAHVDYRGFKKIITYLKYHRNPKATITFHGTEFGARPSPTVPFFSSRGPSSVNGGILKPDILGPGVNILSAWPVKVVPGPEQPPRSYFDFQSGTSMATPHLAGVVALIKSIHKDWSPAAIKSAIMTTADRLDLDSIPITDDYRSRLPADLFSIGAGQVNPQAAIDPGLIYDTTDAQYLQYLCWGLGYSDKNLSVITKTQFECSDMDRISVEDLNYPSISVTLGANVTKTVTRYLTNVGSKGSEVYRAAVTYPSGVRAVVTPNKMGFDKLGMRRKFTVEFKITDESMSKGQTSEGQLLWRSPKHEVRSPISVTFA